MITSNQIINLSEEWLMLIKSNYSSAKVDIYVNPTTSDYLELRKKKVDFVRFVADNRNKKLYISDAIHILHRDIIGNVGGFSGLKTDCNNFSPWFLAGNASLMGNLSNMTYSDMIENIWRYSSNIDNSLSERKKASDILNKILSTDWSWCDKYIKVTDWLSKFKNRVNRK